MKGLFEAGIKTFILWVILRFNREKTYLDMRQTNYSMWLTGTGRGEKLRLNHTEPGGGGSIPVRKSGLFSYEAFLWPGGKCELEKKCGSGVGEAEKWCASIWFNFIVAPWTLGARKTTRGI